MFFVISSCKKLFVMNVGEVNFSCCRAFVYIVWKKVPTEQVVGRVQSAGTPTIPGEHPIFAHSNANKRLISLNRKTRQGYAAMMRLLETADVLISNIRYASLERLEMDYKALKDKFPSMIYAHFSGRNSGETSRILSRKEFVIQLQRAAVVLMDPRLSF